MKKILASSLLGSVLVFSAVCGDELNQNKDGYLEFLRLAAEGNPCDNPNNKQCVEDAKEACQDHGGDAAGCIEYFISINNTAYHQREYADTAEKFVNGIFKGKFTEKKQKALNSFLQEYKKEGYKPKYFLLDRQIDGKTNLEYISQKNLTKIATEIRNVFGSLQNNQALNEDAKNNKRKDNIKKILME